MKKQFTLVFLLLISLQTMSQLPKVTTGTLVRIAGFQSKYIDARNIDIWLPEGFDKTKKYPVLYMHDGQALYSVRNFLPHCAPKEPPSSTALRSGPTTISDSSYLN